MKVAVTSPTYFGLGEMVDSSMATWPLVMPALQTLSVDNSIYKLKENIQDFYSSLVINRFAWFFDMVLVCLGSGVSKLAANFNLEGAEAMSSWNKEAFLLSVVTVAELILVSCAGRTGKTAIATEWYLYTYTLGIQVTNNIIVIGFHQLDIPWGTWN